MDIRSNIHSVKATPYIIQVPVIPFGNEHKYRKITDFFCLFKFTENRNINQLESHTKLPSKDKEYAPSSQDIASSFVSTEVDLTILCSVDPTSYECVTLLTAQKRHYWKKGGKVMKIR